MGTNLASVSLAVLIGVLATACGGKAVPVPESPPPRVIEPSTLADPATLESEPAPPLVAPPPAYGNKVVLARNSRTSAAF